MINSRRYRMEETRMIDYSKAPNNWGDIWELYIEHGILPGSFGESLLCNDLRGTILTADHININLIVEHVGWLYNNAPVACWGSVDRVEAWARRGGMRGIAA